MTTLTINGNNLSIDDVCNVALNNQKVILPEDAEFWETL
jgi:hypothetical protein